MLGNLGPSFNKLPTNLAYILNVFVFMVYVAMQPVVRSLQPAIV